MFRQTMFVDYNFALVFPDLIDSNIGVTTLENRTQYSPLNIVRNYLRINLWKINDLIAKMRLFSGENSAGPTPALIFAAFSNQMYSGVPSRIFFLIYSYAKAKCPFCCKFCKWTIFNSSRYFADLLFKISRFFNSSLTRF